MNVWLTALGLSSALLLSPFLPLNAQVFCCMLALPILTKLSKNRISPKASEANTRNETSATVLKNDNLSLKNATEDTKEISNLDLPVFKDAGVSAEFVDISIEKSEHLVIGNKTCAENEISVSKCTVGDVPEKSPAHVDDVPEKSPAHIDDVPEKSPVQVDDLPEKSPVKDDNLLEKSPTKVDDLPEKNTAQVDYLSDKSSAKIYYADEGYTEGVDIEPSANKKCAECVELTIDRYAEVVNIVKKSSDLSVETVVNEIPAETFNIENEGTVEVVGFADESPAEVIDITDESSETVDIPNVSPAQAVDIAVESSAEIVDIANESSAETVNIENECSAEIVDIADENSAEIVDECSAEIVDECSAEIVDIADECSAEIVDIADECSAEIVDIAEQSSVEIVDIADESSVEIVDIADESSAEIVDIADESSADIVDIADVSSAEIVDIADESLTAVNDITALRSEALDIPSVNPVEVVDNADERCIEIIDIANESSFIVFVDICNESFAEVMVKESSLKVESVSSPECIAHANSIIPEVIDGDESYIKPAIGANEIAPEIPNNPEKSAFTFKTETNNDELITRSWQDAVDNEGKSELISTTKKRITKLEIGTNENFVELVPKPDVISEYVNIEIIVTEVVDKPEENLETPSNNDTLMSVTKHMDQTRQCSKAKLQALGQNSKIEEVTTGIATENCFSNCSLDIIPMEFIYPCLPYFC